MTKVELRQVSMTISDVFASISHDVGAASRALLTDDQEAGASILRAHPEISTAYDQVEVLIAAQSAFDSPDRSDLQDLLAMTRVLSHLEHGRNLIDELARHASRSLVPDIPLRLRLIIRRMADVDAELWRDTARSYQQRDSETGASVRSLDDELDELHTGALAEIVEAEVPLPLALELVLLIRAYERLGHHATNLTTRT